MELKLLIKMIYKITLALKSNQAFCNNNINVVNKK